MAISLPSMQCCSISMGRDESRPHNSPPGTGPAGYYAERIAREGFIGMVFCGSSKMVAPSGSSEPAFGSNPVAIGIPTGSEALVLDMATSAMPIFKVELPVPGIFNAISI